MPGDLPRGNRKKVAMGEKLSWLLYLSNGRTILINIGNRSMKKKKNITLNLEVVICAGQYILLSFQPQIY